MAAFKIIAKAALLVGTLDIPAASLQFYLQTGKSPFKPILLFIASGLFGKNSGLPEEILMTAGLLLYYCITTAFTLFFFLAIGRFTIANKQPLLVGIFYGVFVWAVMNLLVLPITNTRPFVFDAGKNAITMGILIVCIGIPLALITASMKKKAVNI